uniref:Uncharacterized protein n=1 Tax=Arundo donax TaxID=35708 RepID=A0A0A9ABG3_ARUDO
MAAAAAPQHHSSASATDSKGSSSRNHGLLKGEAMDSRANHCGTALADTQQREEARAPAAHDTLPRDLHYLLWQIHPSSPPRARMRGPLLGSR